MSGPHYTDATVTLWHGDALDVLPTLAAESVDAVVTDPPYGLEFMGKEWDKFKSTGSHAEARTRRAGEMSVESKRPFIAAGVNGYQAGYPFQSWCQSWAVECYRVLKPGGHLLAFGGTRTAHRLACAVEDAGFEIRDSIAWIYGQGFPKSLDVSKAIDAAAGAEREVVGYADIARRNHPEALASRGNDGLARMAGKGKINDREVAAQITAPATPDAARWQGWGTALKPAHEPICVARKPLAGTVAGNVLAWGTGALNIDATRIAHASAADLAESEGKNRHAQFGTEPGQNEVYGDFTMVPARDYDGSRGRWPANVALDDTAAAELDEQSGEASYNPAGVFGRQKGNANDGASVPYSACKDGDGIFGYGDRGGASRFFPVFRYEAKAPTSERPRSNGVGHPTTKPLDLIRWLVRLVTPPGGLVLDPFAGSGTTAEAALLEGFRAVVVEREAEYLPHITQRINRRRDPVAYLEAVGEDLGLFGELP